MEIMDKKMAANHSVGEEARFSSDFYRYLLEPENASRYTIACDYLNRVYQDKEFTLLDVGCGNGALANYVSQNVRYTGIDHSTQAIEFCKEKYINSSFFCVDADQFIRDCDGRQEKYDVILFCGMLFHAVDKESLEKRDDAKLIENCANHLLKENGHIVIIAPFAYRDIAEFSFYKQAEWKINCVDVVMDILGVEPVFRSIGCQLGLEKFIQNQNMLPDWFLSADDNTCANKYSGHYLGSWTAIYKFS